MPTEDINKDLLKDALREVLAETTPRRIVIKETVHETLHELGIDADTPHEMQKDFQHLRDARTTMEQVKSKSIMTLIGFVVTGFVAAVWMGVRTFLHID